MVRHEPELPYIFDLVWDIKSRNKLIEALKHSESDTIADLYSAMADHEIVLTFEEKADIDDWRQYISNCKTHGM